MNFLLHEKKVQIGYVDKHREYYIQANGCAIQIMEYCPWCGQKLPLSLRDKWFDELEKLGYDEPFDQNIPIEYTTSVWWKKYGY